MQRVIKSNMFSCFHVVPVLHEGFEDLYNQFMDQWVNQSINQEWADKVTWGLFLWDNLGTFQ